MKKFAKLGVFTAVALCVAMLSLTAFAANFSDIEKHWAKEYIEYGVEQGYISGYEDGTFKPDKTVTRAEFSKMINNASGITATGTAKADFTDVVKTEWYFGEVQKAENAGYITGYSDGTFKPSNPVTRQEAAVILSRIVLPVKERADVTKFADNKSIDSWANDAIAMIAAKGYIKGDEKGNFNPKGALTRSQAAKLICEFVKNENIVNRNKKVTSGEEEIVFSETLFTDDVVIELENADTVVVFKNCRVLGTVNVKTEGAVVEFENTAVKEIAVTGDDAVVTLDRLSSAKKATLAASCKLTGPVADVVLADGTIELTGDFDKVSAEGNVFVSAGKIKNLSVDKKVSLSVQAGTVETLTVGANAKGATINLANKAVIKNAENNAAVSYVGGGTVENANNAVTGVTYDGVTVVKMTGKAAGGESAGEGTAADFFDGVTVSPAKNKKNVSVTSNITFTFPKTVYDANGKKLSVSYVEDTFELHRGSATGTKTAFEAVVSTNKITLKPVSDLKAGTAYYVVIPAGALKNEDGYANAEKYTTNFTTVADGDEEVSESDEKETSGVTMSPKNGATDVSLDTSIKLTFDGTLKASSGELDAEYIEETAIKIYEGSTSGDEVSFTATVSSKTITLNPKRLVGDTKYYVVIAGSKLKVGGSSLPKTTMSFTTEEGTAISISPENGATGISLMPEITVSFAEPTLDRDGEKLTADYIQDEVLIIKKGSTKESADDVYYSVSSIADNGRSFVIVPDEELESNTTYYIIIEAESLLGETTETENAKVTSSFKTASAMAPMFTPYDGKKNVGVGSEIRISFSDELLIYSSDKEKDKQPVDDAYLDELINGYEDSKGKIQGKDRIKLKRVGASKPLAITATLDSDGKTIIITPEDDLLEEKSYTIEIDSKVFRSAQSTSKYNSAGKATFDTNVAMSPVITPKNEAEEVSVTVNPTIKFSEDIFNADGKELKSLYVKNNVITFTNEYDDIIEYDVTISGSTITIEPKEDLEGNVEYTISVAAGTITNEDGLENLGKTVTFTTKISYNIDVTPGSNAKDVSPFVNPTVKFGTEVFTEDGDVVDEEYASEYIFLTEGSKSSDADDAVPATIEIGSDGRTFTIIPDDQLELGTKYYINVVEKKFIYSDEDTKNKASNTYFTTIKEPVLSKATAAANNKTSIKITYTSNVKDTSDDEIVMLVVEDEFGEIVKTAPITSTSSSSVTISKLETDTEYTFSVYIVVDGEIESERKEVTATTKK